MYCLDYILSDGERSPALFEKPGLWWASILAKKRASIPDIKHGYDTTGLRYKHPYSRPMVKEHGNVHVPLHSRTVKEHGNFHVPFYSRIVKVRGNFHVPFTIVC